MRMQQEAIRRVRDMQRRARSTLENAGVPIEPAEPPAPAGDPRGPLDSGPEGNDPDGRHAPGAADASHGGDGYRPGGGSERPVPAGFGGAGPEPPGVGPLRFGLGGTLLPSFNLSLDTEQLVLLGLLYILYRDRCDPWLMIAVAYVLFF